MEPTNPAPVLCINCLHVSVPYSGELAGYKCFNPKNCTGTNLLDGSPEYGERCLELRKGVCGVAGNWWEPKPLPIPTAVPVVNPVAVKQVIKSGAKVGTNLLEDLGM